MRLTAIMGAILIVLSATPFSPVLSAFWLMSLCGWLWTLRVASKSDQRSRMNLPAGVALVSMGVMAVAIEVVTLFPRIPPVNHDTMYVIGDSITAGLNDDDLLWPTILGESHNVTVVNLAQPGAMADSALKQAENIPDDAGGIILIEIGGNDLLSGRSATEYEYNLKRLCEVVSAPNRTLAMMELPLPPFKSEYGRVQRRLARQYDAVLISKRELARVLALSDGTLDGIHLSASGQQLMAEILWKYVGPLFTASSQEVADK
jgi:acyl-CoA thioesterase-1